MSPTQQQAVHHPPQPNRYLLGGMAAVMGTSLFGGSGENDFRSLSALPFSYLFPNAILNPSPLTIQLWTLTKVLLVVGSLASILYQCISKHNSKRRQTQHYSRNFIIGLDLDINRIQNSRQVVSFQERCHNI